jgi:hypothetical protein
MFDRQAQYKRIAQVNPQVALTIADFIHDCDKFDEILFEFFGISEEIADIQGQRKCQTLEIIKSLIGEYTVVDSVAWKASRDTTVYWIKSEKGENYRLWHWKHADNIEMGYQAILYRESPEITAYEISFYD